VVSTVPTSAGPGRGTTHERVTGGDSVAGRTYRCMASRDSKTETGRIASSCRSSKKTKSMGGGSAGLMVLKCLWSRSAGRRRARNAWSAPAQRRSCPTDRTAGGPGHPNVARAARLRPLRRRADSAVERTRSSLSLSLKPKSVSQPAN
jgi:hypothetical protein